MTQLIRSLKVLGALLALGAAYAVPAFAMTAMDAGSGGGEIFATQIFEELCDGDCSGLPSVEHPNGDPFDFVYGGKVGIGGTDIQINSGGSVYVRGPIHSQTRIYMEAGRDITAIGNVSLSADEIFLQTNENYGVKGVEFNFPILGPIIAPPPGPGVLICACVRTTGSHLDASVLDVGDINLEVVDGDIRLASGATAEAVVGVSADGPPLVERLRWSITRDGDIYLDLSMVTDVYRLKIKAGKSIVIVGGDSMPVPEPGTALLLGLGLASLSYKRRKSR